MKVSCVDNQRSLSLPMFASLNGRAAYFGAVDFSMAPFYRRLFERDISGATTVHKS